MKQKKTNETSPEVRRKSIEDDVAAYLASGKKIEQVPSGLSSQDPQGKGKPLRLGQPKPETPKQPEASNTDTKTDAKTESKAS